MTEGNRDRATSHWVCVQCRVQNKIIHSQAKKAEADGDVDGDDPMSSVIPAPKRGRGKFRRSS